MTIETYDELPTPERPRKETKYDWDGLAEAALGSPGRWARMQVPYRSYQNYIRDGSLAAFNGFDGEWETATRTIDGEIYLYVRYVPA